MSQSTTMAALDRVDWYLTGIQPYLRVHCATDAVGNHWESLAPLLTFALAQEHKAQSVRHERNKVKSSTVAAVAYKPPQNAVERKKAVNAQAAQSRKRGRQESHKAPATAPPPAKKGRRSNDWITQCRKEGRCLRCGSKEHRVAACAMPFDAPQPAQFPASV